MNCPICKDSCWRDEHPDGPGYGHSAWRCTACQWTEGDEITEVIADPEAHMRELDKAYEQHR